jgi:hypothetical protein
MGLEMMDDEITGRAKGGRARAEALSPEARKEQARAAAVARWSGAIQKATHGSPDHPLRIGDASIPCYVLPDGTRVLAQRGLQLGIGLSEGGGRSGARRIAELMASLEQKGINIRDLVSRVNSPIRFLPPLGAPADGYEAEILPDICAVLIDAGQQGKLGKQREHLAQRAAMLQHGFATLGIIGLVDEVTGYQRDRAKDALSKILESFIAKELQPYIPTFPADFYEEIFRLRGLEYPGSVKRPQYFGMLTNDIVYKRLAPGVLEELKRVKMEAGRSRDKLFQRLTSNIGYPKLREHLGSVVAIMKLSNGWHDFMDKINRLHPRYGDTIPMSLGYEQDHDDGKGL